MKDLRVFDFRGNDVRTMEINGEPWWVAKDVCEVLGIEPRDSVRHLDQDEKSYVPRTDIGLNPGKDIYIINEPGLYSLIIRSRKPEAKQFKRWVTHEVLPSIRKKGKYEIGSELKKISKKNRRMITDAWKENGVKEPKEYAILTLEEYKALRFPKNERKSDFDKEKILLLAALESMEALNLHYNPVKGFFEAKTSLHNTANIVKSIENKSLVKL